MNPAVSGKYSGVGICGVHINGPSAQRTLAIQRAIDQIAMQLGVKVNNVSMISTKGSSAGASTNVEHYSFQTVEGKVVTAELRKMWRKPGTGEIFIWMVTK
jgi:transketolase C-terminal domain/subunit